MMELALTPVRSDHIRSRRRTRRAPNRMHNWAAWQRPSRNSQGEGLFLLATERFEGPLPPAFSYWRDFAASYLTALCHTPEIAGLELEAIPPPTSGELATLILSVPPMQGAEYLSEATLLDAWNDLDAWTREAIAAGGEGLSGFLKRRAPLWHQVGRVCFHLAENRRSEEYPFAFHGDLRAERGVRFPRPVSAAQQGPARVGRRKNKAALVRLLSPVQAASKKSALVKELVESGDLYQPLAWTPREAYRFLKDAPVLEESGILVRLPDWWKKRPRPRVGVTIGDAKQKKFDAAGDARFQGATGLGRPATQRGRMAGIDGGRRRPGHAPRAMGRGRSPEIAGSPRSLEAGRGAGPGGDFVPGGNAAAGGRSRRSDRGGRRAGRPPMVVRPCRPMAGRRLGQDAQPGEPATAGAPAETLQATLRPYQATGVNWLRFLSGLGLGACLADDMGLGKTIQVLALLLALKGQKSTSKPSSPRSWCSRPRCWATGRRRWPASRRRSAPHSCIRPKRPRKNSTASRRTPAAALRDIDVVVTSYGMLLRQEWLTEIRWQLAVLDEAQAIKNPAARQTKAVKRLQADARIVLTGTPVENRLSDLWSLFDFLCPGLLGTQAKFKEFAKKLGDRQENRYAPLRSLVQPYILRRLKTDRRIIDDLPDKVEVRAFCGLSKRQAAMYAKLVHELAETLKNVEGMKRRGLVLAYLMRFKQLCNHPSQLLGRRPVRCRGERQVRPAGRDLRRDCLAAAAGPGLHAVPRNDRALGGIPGGGLRTCRGWCSTAARPSNAARPSSISSNATTGRRSSSSR